MHRAYANAKQVGEKGKLSKSSKQFELDD